ncbi:MAG: protein phosphatase 2C domain-containing protein [Pseudomonadota bacterium]
MSDGFFLLEELYEARRADGALAGGEFAAFTSRSPDKATENEDTVGWMPISNTVGVLVVADGAGGMPAGAHASKLAVRSLFETLLTSNHDTLIDALIAGIGRANLDVIDEYGGAATTMTTLLVEDDTVRALQVGDSEALLTGQRGKLRYRTTPHSPTGYAIEAGYLDEYIALFHPERHLVSNFVGTIDMTIEVGPSVSMRPLDTLVVASDGLTDNLFRDEVIELARKGPLLEAREQLVGTAQERMLAPLSGCPSKPDDLSLIVFRRRRKSRR